MLFIFVVMKCYSHAHTHTHAKNETYSFYYLCNTIDLINLWPIYDLWIPINVILLIKSHTYLNTCVYIECYTNRVFGIFDTKTASFRNFIFGSKVYLFLSLSRKHKSRIHTTQFTKRRKEKILNNLVVGRCSWSIDSMCKRLLIQMLKYMRQ